MRTTLDLPDALMREVKVRAAQQDRKLKEVVEELLRTGLGQKPLAPGSSMPPEPRPVQAKVRRPSPKRTVSKAAPPKPQPAAESDDDSVIDSSFPL